VQACSEHGPWVRGVGARQQSDPRIGQSPHVVLGPRVGRPAWSAAVNVGNGAYIIDGCPPGAVAPTPNERTSATSGREVACSLALATRSGLLNMSRTVVTPKVNDCARAPGTR
jgi:hypothetical protein